MDAEVETRLHGVVGVIFPIKYEMLIDGHNKWTKFVPPL